MLKPAQLYKDQLREKQCEFMYDMNSMYFHSWCGIELTSIKDDNWDCHSFVSIDENNNVIGYITYNVDHTSLNASGFGIISYDRGNLTFIKDVYQAIEDIFLKYNFNRIEWYCYADNPAVKGYRKFIKRVGGCECGYKRQHTMLLDHKLHDIIEFEILKEEFKPIKRGVHKNV